MVQATQDVGGGSLKPPEEIQRLSTLFGYDLDYTETQEVFGDLIDLAKAVTGRKIALLNLIDDVTQWSISRSGTELSQMARGDSVCQLTMFEAERLEVEDLSEDERFREKFYVCGDPGLRFYSGVPLRSPRDEPLGALCVLDDRPGRLTDHEAKLLQMVAVSVARRLEWVRESREYRQCLRTTLHDLRNPLSGVLGLSRGALRKARTENHKCFAGSLEKIFGASHELLQMLDQGLNPDAAQKDNEARETDQVSAVNLAEKLMQLYQPQAEVKQVELVFFPESQSEDLTFEKCNLMPMIGNLVANAIKFSQRYGTVAVQLNALEEEGAKQLRLSVHDSGVGMNPEQVSAVLSGQSDSTKGSSGERGFGLGLASVRQLLYSRGGSWEIDSRAGEGTEFRLVIPVR